MKYKLQKIIYYSQIIFFYITYFILKFFKIRKKYKWCIGVDEIANNIKFLGEILDDSITVSLSKNKFYNNKYNFFIKTSNKYLFFLIRIFYGPLLFAYLIRKVDNFFYIWSTGFLFNREFEFKFLKRKGKKIVCLFCGDDIRSPKKRLEYFKRKNIDTSVEYVAFCNPRYLSDEYEREKKEIARIADSYADIIFNHKLDQPSYLKSKQYEFLIPYYENKFNKNINKFHNIEKIKIVHAPSSPIVKGTPLVRAAIKKLQEEGYEFDYIELSNMPNEEVLEHLRTSHIVLNQFYSLASGLLGIEGMANYCAVMMRAYYYFDYDHEPWVKTEYYEVYDKLKYLLDNPKEIQQYAEAGFNFVKKYHSYSAIKQFLYKMLREENIL